MLAQPKLLSWSSAKARILNQLHCTATIHEESLHLSRRTSTLASKVPQFPLFSSRPLTKFKFDTHLQAFTYYRSIDEDDNSDDVEDMIITSLFYDDPKDPRSAIVVYFTSLNTGIIRRYLKYDFQFPSFQLLKYISKLKLIVGYSNNRLYLLSNKNGQLKYLTSIKCPGVARRIIYDKTSRDIIYVGGDNGFFVRWYLVQEIGGYDLRLGDRLKSVFINRKHNIIDMKLDPITHKLFIVGHKGCLIFDTLLNRESASVLSAHGAPVTCAIIYGFSIIMGFSDGVMKIFEIGSESIPIRYQLQVHKAAMMSLLITADGVIVTGAEDGTVCFYSLDSLLKLGEHRFNEPIERMMLVRGEDLLIKFKHELQLLVYTLPIRSFSHALQANEQVRVTFPVGSIPARVAIRGPQNLFTLYNPRSSQIINIIPLSPDRIIVNDFVFDTAGEILYILTSKAVCSYYCASYPSYLMNIFEVKDECLFTKLCCFMWFSLLPEYTRKRRAFGVVFVGTTNGKLYLVPGDHKLKYALLPDTSEALYSYYQILDDTVTVDCLEIFQAYETYTTRRGARYLLAVGNDFIAKFYRLSINGHDIFLRQLGLAIRLDAPCIGAAMAEHRIAIACNQRGYIQMYSLTINGLDEISPKDILYEHSPIKSLTGCDTLGLFATLNTQNEIMLWTRNNEAIRKIKCDFPLISIANLNDRGDILLISNRRLNFLMISDFAPEQVLFDLSKKTIKDDSIELPVQINKNFDQNIVESAKTIQLDERIISKVPTDLDEPDVLGFFEALEKEKAQAEMAKMLEKKKQCPIAPDALIPNSTLRSMFKMKEIEPVEVKMFQLRLISPTTSNTRQNELDDRLKRFAVLTNFDGIHSTIFQSLNKIDILDNLENKTNKNLNWQNDDDEWVELEDPESSIVQPSSKPPSAKKLKHVHPKSSTIRPRQQLDDDFSIEDIQYNIYWDEETIPELFKKMKNESWWQQTDDEANNSLRSMLLYLIEIIRAKQNDSYESACNYVVDIFRTYGIEPSLVNQILNILLNHLSEGENDPLNIHTVRTIAQFMIERKDIIVPLLNFTLKCQPDNILRQETINAIKFITDVNNSDDIDLVLNNMSIVRDAAEDTFSLKTIIDRIKYKQSQTASDLIDEEKDSEKIDDNILHPLLKKISDERWYPRDNNPITLDSIIDAILVKLPTASKTLLKTLTSHLVQLHRAIGYSNEQFDQVSNGIISLLSHTDADHRLIAATTLADLGKETKAIDIALLNSFINDPRILVRTECCDTLKRLTSVMSDTVLKDCADDIPYLQTLPEEDFSLQNYLREKNRALTPPPSTADDHPSVPIDGKQEDEKQEDEEQEEEEENLLPTNEEQQENLYINIEDSTYHPSPDINEQIDDIKPIVRSRSSTPRIDEQPTIHKSRHVLQQTPSQFSVTPSLNSSTVVVTPVEPPIRVEINEKPRPILQASHHVPKSRKELPQPSSLSSLQTPRLRKQPTVPIEKSSRTSVKTSVSDQSSGKRHPLLPNNSTMWDSYAKQNEILEQNKTQIQPSIDSNQEQISDPIQTIINDHKRDFGYYRMIPNRRILIPHKISLMDLFSDQIHITVNRRSSSQLTTSTMRLSDLNRNKRHLHEVEFMQLLSSLIIRSIQLHKRNEKFIPNSLLLNTHSAINFTDALTVSQMQLHSLTNLHQPSFSTSYKLPPIERQRPSSAQTARMKSDTHTRATKTGVNLRKAKDMEDALSNLLKSNRDLQRSTLIHERITHSTGTPIVYDQHEITHAWLLEQLLKSQGTSDSENHIQQIARTYPKFTPLLYSRVPEHLISIIWNDPVMRQLASIIGNKQDDSSIENISMKHTDTKPTIPAFDDEHSSNFFDYEASSQLLAMQQQQRDDHKKEFLPTVRGVKMRLPRHVLKFGFRELDLDSPEESIISLRDEGTSKSRRRRIYMHLMCNHDNN
ncbi:unnamed protein product [Rotaria sordida]|uniref:Uncharacterized protein n=1 Tax=Rotaria sordida TaxID=392033 RepID=A0A814FD50_9BILA|nr:unnamed protein product [Rotaria sordida]